MPTLGEWITLASGLVDGPALARPQEEAEGGQVMVLLISAGWHHPFGILLSSLCLLTPGSANLSCTQLPSSVQSRGIFFRELAHNLSNLLVRVRHSMASGRRVGHFAGVRTLYKHAILACSIVSP